MGSFDGVAIIGAGAAGLMAAATAAERGREVTVFEKMSKPGRKILATGGGRCNFTTACTRREIEQAFGRTGGRFLRHALAVFGPEKIVSFFEECGVPVKLEQGKRYFPESGRAKDILDALLRRAGNSGSVIRTSRSIKKIERDRKGFLLTTEHEVKNTDRLLITTGGMSMSRTGSTGDGYRFAESLGHTIVKLHAALVPVETEEDWVAELAGLNLVNVRLTCRMAGKKKSAPRFGEMIFTHYGISGPIVMDASKEIGEALVDGPVAVEIDLKPALDHGKLDARILRDFSKTPRRQFRNSLDRLLPKSLIPVIVRLSEISPEKRVAEISKEERARLRILLKGLPLTVTKLRPIEEAIITAGGVALKEIDPGTMESRLVPGLFFAGEVLDLDGPTGGFNLTAAWSTAYLAGLNL
ncbi:MAG: NAD(P)/FAD-dependent oxidoreductase [Planctomycetota bacterium]|nr:MAG: NAD(P)/FAD-dependent oxidoreductase [Planctomycetota bacterium]